ncbi:hypothetical protein F383_11245 [Gossypium arboreum]|uniref:Transmembrane protein n=2 Tax=Gossypium TaxID=3633 RepID=A0A0B0Q3C6_GOSAR|nr:hypothetical protein F383_11245 [Gossypium arboreum]TYG90437.1 hypothetical protein ES288_A12G181900v1 [Gossypium darwinii]
MQLHPCNTLCNNSLLPQIPSSLPPFISLSSFLLQLHLLLLLFVYIYITFLLHLTTYFYYTIKPQLQSQLPTTSSSSWGVSFVRHNPRQKGKKKLVLRDMQTDKA